MSAIKPFKPTCEVRHFPVDTRFDHASALNFFTEHIQPTRILTNSYVKSKIAEKTVKSDQKQTDLLDKIQISKSGDTHTFKLDENVTKYQKIRVGPHLSKRIKLAEVTGNSQDWMCSFKGVITERDGSYNIDLPHDEEMVRENLAGDNVLDDKIMVSKYDGRRIDDKEKRKRDKERKKLEEKKRAEIAKRKYDDNFVRAVGLKEPNFEVLVDNLRKAEIGEISTDDFQYQGNRFNMVTVSGKISIKLMRSETAIEILDPTDKNVRKLKKKVVAVLMNHISI